MKRSYQTWTVRGYMRRVMEWTSDGVPIPAGYSEPVVVVFDPRGWEWHVTADGDRITSLTVRGEHVDSKALRVVPLGYLAEVARTYLGDVERADREGLPLSAALDGANADPGQVRLSGDAPTPEAFAEVWNKTPAVELRSGERMTRRQRLADLWHVSPYAIDKWTRAARDAGLIPEAVTGRGHHKTDQSKHPGTPARPRERNEE